MSGGSDRDETFLARWARRKRSGESAPAEPAREPAPPAKVEAASDDQKAASADEVDIAALPRIEDLLPSSDITQFLRKGVPDELQRRALRRAWTLDPAIRDFIEVAENQYDWNAPDGVPGFGPLEPGVNVKALLAQATGMPEPAEATSDTNVKATSSVTADVAESGGHERGTVDAGQQASPASQNAAPAANQDAAPANEPVATATQCGPSERPAVAAGLEKPGTRRRHGGALPA